MYATTYTDVEDIYDDCGNKIVLQVTRDITESPNECREFKKEMLSGKDIELYSVSGGMIKHNEVPPNIYSYEVDMSEVEAGIYLLKIIDKENGEYTVEKIIKQ